MDDNARPHRNLAVEELLESEDITRMDWPAYSPDLNPIEHVWDALGRRIAACLHHPENTQKLKQMLIEEWAISAATVRRRLHMNGRYAMSPRICVSLFVQSRVARLSGAENKGHLTVSDWGNAMLTDESRFALEPDDKRIRMWRKQ
ncbi:transposable element Tcb1 transposase [Trichonephila clavipes]|nr:transposable element Tcb1 transposase [Trichonephila clavipes]